MRACRERHASADILFDFATSGRYTGGTMKNTLFRLTAFLLTCGAAAYLYAVRTPDKAPLEPPAVCEPTDMELLNTPTAPLTEPESEEEWRALQTPAPQDVAE